MNNNEIIYSTIEFCHYWQACEFMAACQKRHISYKEPYMDTYGHFHIEVRRCKALMDLNHMIQILTDEEYDDESNC